MQTIPHRDMERVADPYDAKTRELPRPVLASRPRPLGWAHEAGMLVHLRSGMQMEDLLSADLDDGDLVDLEVLGRDIADMAAWAYRERSVRAQLTDAHRAILDDIAAHGPSWPLPAAASDLEAMGLLRFDNCNTGYHLTPAGLAVVQGGPR